MLTWIVEIDSKSSKILLGEWIFFEHRKLNRFILKYFSSFLTWFYYHSSSSRNTKCGSLLNIFLTWPLLYFMLQVNKKKRVMHPFLFTVHFTSLIFTGCVYTKSTTHAYNKHFCLNLTLSKYFSFFTCSIPFFIAKLKKECFPNKTLQTCIPTTWRTSLL